MKILNWNLRYPGKESARQRVRYLTEQDWDILTLQEVSRSAQDALVASGLATGSVYGLKLLGELLGERLGGRAHGAAVLVKSPYRIAEAKLLLGIPKPERGVSVQVIAGDNNRSLRIVSWHSPSASGEVRKFGTRKGVQVKMQAYRGLIEHLNESSSPTIVGFDANHWNLRTALTPAPAPELNDPFYVENRFFSREPTHALRDAYLSYLASRPDIHVDLVKRNPRGPLATSYVRPRSQVADRYDYIFLSEHFAVDHLKYDYEGAAKVKAKDGSDHASISAELRLR